MIHHLIAGLVAHHVARHAIHHALNVAPTAQHAQGANTLQKVAQASTIIGGGKAGYELYIKSTLEYKKHMLPEKIQILQEEQENLENA